MAITKEPKTKDPRTTPAMRQYFSFKERYPTCVLFFRMGDFYELFGDDAILANRVLGLTLTERSAGLPMAGVPHHSAEGYFRRMIQAGHRVAVGEQTQDPKDAVGVVERAVTRVLTPGTLSDESLLDGDASNNLAAISFLDAGDADDGRVALAVVELSTGAFALIETTARAVIDEIARRNIDELLFAQSAAGQTPARAQKILDALDLSGTPRPGWQFRHAEAFEALQVQYKVATLGGFGFDDDDPSLAAAGAVIQYLHETQALDSRAEAPRLSHLAPPKREDPTEALLVDAASLRALEIERTMRPGSTDRSLLSVFQGAGQCRTAMGRRLLRDWLLRPLARLEPIQARQACVATLVCDERTSESLDRALSSIHDAARIAGRLGVGRATPRDLVALGSSLSGLDALIDAIANAPAFADHCNTLEGLRDALDPIAQDIVRLCVDHPPAHLREGGLIRDGVDAALDEARLLQSDAAAWLAQHQTHLIEKHELPGVKIGYNRVFGYYIELTTAQAKHAPPEFIRKQTLKNAERYITPELKEFEEKVMSAQSRALDREHHLFAELCQRCAAQAPAIRAFGQTVAALDCLGCFARLASRRGWVKPDLVAEPVLDIREGAHPVLEHTLGDRFVPNDAVLGAHDDPDATARLALITGPNMAGKSTYIRQIALIVLLAHTGSFVPAQSATIGLTDRIFTRVGADDALHAGQSTFMVEMVETANILHHATTHSLVILDEIGRGTSTLDGLSLAWAIAERLAGDTNSNKPHSTPTPRTLFATHYHELTTLEEELPGRVRNLHVQVREWGEEIVFLHRIAPGPADQSYGVHVAKLAGLPPAVVARARELLDTLSVTHDGAPDRPSVSAPARSAPPQLTLFREYAEHPAIEELRQLDLNAMSPIEAFDLLRSLRERLIDEHEIS